jgi:pilus assembly protein CpaE
VLAALHALRHNFALLVIDLPSILNDATMAALEQADTIALVATADPASIQATIGTLQALKGFGEKIRLILNHTAPGQPATPKALERVFRRPIDSVVPFDPAQAQALARGKPLVYTSPNSPLAQAVTAFVPALQPASTSRSATG